MKVGIPGMGYVRLDTSAPWPPMLEFRGAPRTSGTLPARSVALPTVPDIDDRRHPSSRSVASLERHAALRGCVALDGVDLDIPAQKMIGLIGPDGVGKSTLLGMIAGVRQDPAGNVRVLGGDIADARFRNSVFVARRIYASGIGQEPLSDLVDL